MSEANDLKLFYPDAVLSVASDGVVIRIVDENTFVTRLMFNISLAIVKFFLWSLLPLVVVRTLSVFIGDISSEADVAIALEGERLSGRDSKTSLAWLVICSSSTAKKYLREET